MHQDHIIGEMVQHYNFIFLQDMSQGCMLTAGGPRLHSISQTLSKFWQRGREEKYIEVVRCGVTLVTRIQHYRHHVPITPK